MNLYPGMRGHMGRWDYFVIKMSMRELAESVKFAHDVYDNKTLDDAIQRTLKQSRVRKQIISYLQRHEDRFFSSIVIAALKGNPKWFPVQIAEEPGFEILAGDARLDETFGVLRFDGTQVYYALDGQHRLAAIQALVNEQPDDAPAGFADEEVSVIVVAPRKEESNTEFMKRYRRLFGHLNRYAKPTSKVEDIIMDEDDAFAIITRRLITDHDFFRATGKAKDSPRIKTEGGKNLKRSDTYFTHLDSLYEMNISLLKTKSRRNKAQGWCSDEEGQDLNDFKRFRPSDECIDDLHRELELYWDGLLEELPLLRKDPPTMRDHDADPEGNGEGEEEEETQDNLLFWPIGQEMLARLIRDLLDQRLPDPKDPSRAAIKSALAGLADLQWELHLAPWRFFVLTKDEQKGWRMRSEERSKVMEIAEQIQQWVIGLDERSEDEVGELKEQWANRLIPAQSEEEIERMWAEVAERRAEVTASVAAS
jgi:DNA sulfur modification protein DndB